jgi:hypothetical protein
LIEVVVLETETKTRVIEVVVVETDRHQSDG